MTSSRILGEWVALLLATALLVFVAVQEGWTQRLDAKLLDETSHWRLSQPSGQIVLVEIDDRSLAQVGNWPWDRTLHADLLNKLSQVQSKMVVYDILFLEPTTAEIDDQLANAIANAENVVLAHSFAPRPGTQDQIAPALPLAKFQEGALGIGHVAVSPDEDGVVRRFSMNIEAQEQQWPHIALKTLGSVKGGETASGYNGLVPIVPMHSAGAFAKVSASDVLAGSTPAAVLQDKIVIVGATAQGLGDRYSVTSHAGRIMAGAEIQANLLHAMLAGEVVYPVSTSTTLAILLAVLAVLFVALWKLPPPWAWRVSLATILALIILSTILLVFFGLWLPVSSAILGILIAYPVWGWRRLSAVSRFLGAEAEKLTSGRPIDDDEAEGFDLVAKQVSVLKSLVGETRDRLSFLSKVLAISPDPMMVFGGDGQLMLLNHKAEALFGDGATRKGLTFSDLWRDAGAVLDGDKSELAFNDGSVFLVAMSEPGDNSTDRIYALRDVTSEREAADNRATMLEFLSHDMRSPQVAIVGLAAGTGLSLAEQERFERIEQQARRTLKLTDDFVQISRLEHNGITPVEADIGALLHEALDRAYPEARRKQIKLKNEIPEDPEFCDVDPLAISRALDNLLGNAIKFSDAETSVTLRLKRDDEQYIRIEISDEGPGLPEERLNNTYARFGAHDTRAGPSAGLGLAYVKRVVDEHGGTIRVKSDAASGTTFILSIPCAVPCVGQT